MKASSSGRSVIFAVALLVGTDALADPSESEKQVCSTSYEDAQRSQKAGKLVASRDAFLRCAAESCPSVVRQECLSAMPDIEKAIPTVVFDAIDESGKQVIDVVVTDGDAQVASQIDGRPVMLDPGPHKFRFSSKHAKMATAIVDVVLLEGEQRRTVRGELVPGAEPEEPEGPETSRPYGPWPWVLAGAGLAVVGGGVALVAVGSSQVSEAEELCGDDRSCDGNADAAELGNAGNLKVNLGIGFLAGGGAMIAGGVLWQLLGNQAETVQVAPVASGDFVGLVGRGRF